MNLRDCVGNYFFFGPLLTIGGFGAALLVLLPPFLDISSSSRVGYVILPFVGLRDVSDDSSCTIASARSAAAVASVCPTIASMTPYSLASLALIQLNVWRHVCRPRHRCGTSSLTAAPFLG